MTDEMLTDGVVTLRPSTPDDAPLIIAARDAAFHRFIGEGSAVPTPEYVIVVDGSVRLSRMVPGMGEECLSILGRGEVFGEMALIDGKARSARATAASKTVAGVLSGEALARLMAAVPAVALNIGQSAVSRLRHADDGRVTARTTLDELLPDRFAL